MGYLNRILPKETVSMLREKAVHSMEKIENCPYIWGGKGDKINVWDRVTKKFTVIPTSVPAFDCSGAYGHCVKAATNGELDLLFTHNTDAYWNTMNSVLIPSLGDAVLYGGAGDKDVDHIMMVVKITPGGVEVMGASGGDSRTNSLMVAEMKGAKVKRYVSHMYRKDFRGFRDFASLLGQ